MRTNKREMALGYSRRCLIALVAAVPLLLLFTGCSTTHYKEAADKEAYAIIKDKSPNVPNSDQAFTIDQPASDPLGTLPLVEKSDEGMGDAGQEEVGARMVTLEQALAIAIKHSRDYQNQKEGLYLAALSLTLDRHEFTPIFSGNISGEYQSTTRDVQQLNTVSAMASVAPDLVRQIGQMAGTPADLLTRYASLVSEATALTGLDEAETVTVRDEQLTGAVTAGVGLLLKGGGRIAIDITSNFLRFLTGDPNSSASSALAATITQPILRGAGRKVAAERLTQSERDVLYALRDYTLFRKEFAVDVASEYYNVLEARDAVRNNYTLFLAFKSTSDRDRALVAEGRKTVADLGRIQQAELNAENSYTNSILNYRRALDNYKIQLGLSVDSKLILDPKELDLLRQQGITECKIAPEDAIQVALASRLDLYNAKDTVEDAKRKLIVAKNNLKPGLDVVISGRVNSEDDGAALEFDLDKTRWNAGLDLDLPLDQKDERNAFRASMISLERTQRQCALTEDRVKLSVRDAWRALDQARQTYEIRKLGVRINEMRVEEQQIRTELGKGNALDLVDAQNDLTSAQNDLTAALVAHNVARLEFWRDMGILFIKDNGHWEEVTDDSGFTSNTPAAQG